MIDDSTTAADHQPFSHLSMYPFCFSILLGSFVVAASFLLSFVLFSLHLFCSTTGAFPSGSRLAEQVVLAKLDLDRPGNGMNVTPPFGPRSDDVLSITSDIACFCRRASWTLRADPQHRVATTYDDDAAPLSRQHLNGPRARARPDRARYWPVLILCAASAKLTGTRSLVLVCASARIQALPCLLAFWGLPAPRGMGRMATRGRFHSFIRSFWEGGPIPHYISPSSSSP